jgi:DNA-binding phage protein
VTPTLRSRLLTAVQAVQEAQKISEVAELAKTGRMTIYRALKSPDSLRVGMADKLIAAASEVLSKRF